MSEVRQCDRCGLLFPISQEGYSKVKGTVHRKYNDGSNYEESVTKDFCSNCTSDMNGSKVVMPALENVEPPRQN